MNLVLLLVVIAEICLGTCIWLTPDALRRMAAHLLTRADVIEAARKEHTLRLQFWNQELGVDRAGDGNEFHEMAAVQTTLRR